MIKLFKSDIYRIGDTVYENDEGNCEFVFYEECKDYEAQYILLRSILLLFGEQMRIVSVEEYVDDKDVTIALITNLPWESFVKAGQEDTEEE